ncbi:hypothetical protein GCM10027049_13920 [Mucilaginibacter puniceus]
MFKRYTLFICLALLTALVACSKFSSDSSDSLSSTTILEKANSQSEISIADTVVPADAANAKKFGVVGDGVTDDTEKLQNLINTQTKILLPAGTYIINKVLNLRSNVKIYGATGATIMAGNKMSGALLTNGHFFYLDKADNCLIFNLIFKKSSQSFTLKEWSNACIFASNSKGTNVLSNTFNFNLNYGKQGLEAVWFTGSETTNTVIKGNKLYTVGIEYAEAGASRSLVQNNYIKNAHGIAINAHGNNTSVCADNIVSDNVIEYPGNMGIEDWGNTSGTIIKNNIISHTGQDPLRRDDAMGISAVGSRPQILNNQITDAWMYYIEIGGNSNKTVDGNIINDTRGLATGIIINYTDTSSINQANTNNKVTITNNQIFNCELGVNYYGSNNINTLLQSNTFKNPKVSAVKFDSDAAIIDADVSNNNVSITDPTTKTRSIFVAYTRKAPNAVKHSISFTNNNIVYEATARGSTAEEYAFYLATNNTSIKNNIIQSAVTSLYAVGNSSNNKLNLYFTNNKFSGVKNDLSLFNLLENSGNVITK